MRGETTRSTSARTGKTAGGGAPFLRRRARFRPYALGVGALMNIVPKLTLALVGGMCVVLAANGYTRVKREVEVYEADRKRDHERMGRALAVAVTSLWRGQGQGAAMANIDEVNAQFTRIRIRWLDRSRSYQINL